MCVAASQVGKAPLQSAFARQATHVPDVVSQTVVVPPHALLLVAEHAPQAPEGSQAAATPPQSPSPAQPRHVCVDVSQTGVVPEHCAADRQPTHEPVTTLQAGTVPTHAVTFVVEQAPHEPFG